MLNENFKDMLSAFGEVGADYLLVGAYAMAAHGCPRATADIDFWVRPTQANRVSPEERDANTSKEALEWSVRIDFRTGKIAWLANLAPEPILFGPNTVRPSGCCKGG
jgi:hypothetical protein